MTARSITDFELRAAINATSARPARAFVKPLTVKPRPAVVPLPDPIHTRRCGEPGCYKPMSSVGDVFTCVCGRVDTVLNRKHVPGYGIVPLVLAQRPTVKP